MIDYNTKGGPIMKKPGTYDKNGSLVCELIKGNIENNRNLSSFFPNKELFLKDQDKITEILIPKGITYIGGSVFRHYPSLVSVTIPDSVRTIGFCAFYDRTSLTTIHIPNSVEKIKNGAFYHCNSLMTINLPDNLEELDDYVFSECTSLSTITYKGTVYTSKSALIAELQKNKVIVGVDVFHNTNLQP